MAETRQPEALHVVPPASVADEVRRNTRPSTAALHLEPPATVAGEAKRNGLAWGSRVCPICGSLFTRTRRFRVWEGGGRLFCSVACSRAGKAISRKRFEAGRRLRRRLSRAALPPCAQCGERFERQRRDARFCSNRCRQAAYRKNNRNAKAT